MVFWLGILVGVLFTWLAIKIGFFETWAMFFNIIISVYLAVYIRPILADVAPVTGDTPYSKALTVMAIATASFLILHSISYIFFTSQFNVSFPKILNTLGAGFLGFLAGFLIWSFVSLLIFITPISQNTFVKEIGFGSQFEQTNMPYISWWCNLVNTVVSRQGHKVTAERTIIGLLKNAESKVPAKTTEQAEPNEPVELNDVKTSPAPAEHGES